MQETTNYKLKKQELTDKADITQISGNWDTIDAELATIDGKTGGTINGDVSIAGALNMSGPIKTTKAEILQTQVDVTKGEAPAETKYSYISMYDKNGWDNSANRLAHIDYMVGADGAATLNLSVNKFEQAGGETPASLNVRYQADGTPRIFLSHNPKKESNSQDIATTGWVRGLTATTAEYGLVKLADENAALAPTDPLAAVNVPLLYELADYRRLNTAYNVGDCVGCAFQFDLFLECTQAGTTSGDTLDTRTVTHGQTINDGSVIWTVRKAIKSVNGALPDAAGNVTITAEAVSGAVRSVNTVGPDGAGNVTITAANVSGSVRSVNNVQPDGNGNVTLEIEQGIDFNQIYPVGSIYMSMNPTDPGTLFGGTWQALNEGRVLIGANATYAAGSTGGEATHTLTTNEMPAHTHTGSTASAGSHTHTGSTSSAGSHSHNSGVTDDVYHSFVQYTSYKNSSKYSFMNETSHAVNYQSTTSSGGSHSHSMSLNSAGSHTHTMNLNNTGGGQAHNNMQPYLAVYMWTRIA